MPKRSLQKKLIIIAANILLCLLITCLVLHKNISAVSGITGAAAAITASVIPVCITPLWKQVNKLSFRKPILKGLLLDLIFIPIICFAASSTAINTQAILTNRQIKNENTYIKSKTEELEEITAQKEKLDTTLTLKIEKAVTEATLKDQTDVDNLTEVRDNIAFRSNSLQEQKTTLDNELDGLNKRLALLENNDSQEQIDSLNTMIREKQEKLEKINEELDTISAEMARYQDEINSIQTIVNAAKKQAIDSVTQAEAKTIEEIDSLNASIKDTTADIETHRQTAIAADETLTASRKAMLFQICIIEATANIAGIAMNMILAKHKQH